MGGKGECRDLYEYAVRGVTGTGYDQCPVTGRLLAIGVRYSVTDNCHGSNWVSCIAFDPKDNDVLVSGSYDCTIKKWRLSSGECLATYRGHG